MHLVLVDENGAQVLALSRGTTLFKSNLAVEDANGTEVGRIVQRNLMGRIRFDLEAGGTVVGALQGENCAPGTSASTTPRARRSPA